MRFELNSVEWVVCFSPDVEMIESEKIGRGTFASIRSLGPLQNSVQIWGTSRETFAKNRDLVVPVNVTLIYIFLFTMSY